MKNKNHDGAKQGARKDHMIRETKGGTTVRVGGPTKGKLRKGQ